MVLYFCDLFTMIVRTDTAIGERGGTPRVTGTHMGHTREVRARVSSRFEEHRSMHAVETCSDDLICARIAQVCNTSPDAIAVEVSGLAFSYRELDRRANQMAALRGLTSLKVRFDPGPRLKRDRTSSIGTHGPADRLA